MTFISILTNFFTIFNSFFYTIKTDKVDSLPIIISWKYNENDFLNKISIPVDTNIYNFHDYNPANILKSYIYNSNIGTPLLPNIFNERKSFNFFFLNFYYPYLFTKYNDFYINTRKPFSKIVYVNGGPSSAKEESINVFHTQNVNPYFNFGLNFYSGSSQGYLQWNKTRRNSFKFFTSYEGTKYSFYSTFRINKFSCYENGGITNDSLIFDETFTSQGDLPVNLSGQGTPPHDKANVINSFKNISINVNQKYTLYNSKDSLKPLNIELINFYEIELNKRNFLDIYPSTGIEKNFIKSLYFNNNKTSDSLSYNYYLLDVGILANINKLKIFLLNSYNYNSYSIFSLDQNRVLNNAKYPPFYFSFRYLNNGIKSGIIYSFDNLKLFTYFNYNLYGYDSKSFNFKTDFETKFLKNILKINFELQKVKPSFFFEKYFSNNFIWLNNFDFENKYFFSITLQNPLITISFNKNILNNYVFFNNIVVPEQFKNNIVVNSIYFENKMNLGKFYFYNNFIIQKSSNSDIIDLPSIIVNHSLSFNQTIKFFTGGILETSTGYEFKYYSSFFAPKYSPYLSIFYQQKDKKIGDYPFINVFLQVKLKRVRFFIKYEHVNYKLFNKEYFAGIGYPLMERTLKYGLSWHFYD